MYHHCLFDVITSSPSQLCRQAEDINFSMSTFLQCHCQSYFLIMVPHQSNPPFRLLLPSALDASEHAIPSCFLLSNQTLSAICTILKHISKFHYDYNHIYNAQEPTPLIKLLAELSFIGNAWFEPPMGKTHVSYKSYFGMNQT